jgi:hypothetical protein
MACSRQPGAQVFIQFIQSFTGEDVSQRDWHELRKRAEANWGEDLSRSRASAQEIEEVSIALATSIQLQNDAPPINEEAVESLKEKATSLASISQGTITTVRYMAEQGVRHALKEARAGEESAVDPDRPLYLHGTTVETVSREEDGSVTYVADYKGNDQREIYVTSEDKDGYREIEIEEYEGCQILPPGIDEKRFVANLFMLARDAEYSFGVTDISHIDVPKK